MNRRAIVSIRFHLRNNAFEMKMEDFKAMYGFTADDFNEPAAFDRNAFRKAITRSNENFQANRAKGSRIRNLMLRMIQKAYVAHPFARFQQGSVQRDELFLLWSILHKRLMNIAHYMIKHLQRASKKTTGTLCCGGVIGSIALHLGVNTDDLVEDMGEILMDFEFLKRTEFIAVDRRRRAYLLQRENDHYPLSDAVNTYVNVPGFTINWAMNDTVPREAVAARPPVLPWRHCESNSWYGENNPHVKVPEHLLEAEHEEEDNEDDDEEMPQQGADEADPSKLRRRGREERFEEEISSINTRLGNLEVSVQQMSDRHEGHRAQFNAHNEAHWTQFTTQNNTQWANFNALYDKRWNMYLQHQQEFRGFWPPPPPPPQQ